MFFVVNFSARFYSAEVFSYDNFMNELCPFFETMHRNLNIEMQLSALRCLHYVTTFSSQLFRSLALICRYVVVLLNFIYGKKSISKR